MADNVFIGFDLGTTALKIAAYDLRDGTCIRLVSRETEILTPREDWVEYDPVSYRNLLFSSLKEVVSHLKDGVIGGISVSSQGQTFVMLDAAGRPLRNIVVWLDNRAAKEADELNSEFAGKVGREAPSRKFNSVGSAAKWRWFARREPDVWRRTDKVMMLPEYVTWLLTGERKVDADNAASSLCLRREEVRWVPEVVEACGARLSQLGQPVPAGTLIGPLLPEVCVKLGIRKKPAVYAGTNDQLDGAIGVGNDRVGIVSGMAGTAIALITNLGGSRPDLSAAPGVGSGPYPIPGQRYVLTYGKTGATLLTWFKNNFMPESSYDSISKGVSNVPIGCEGMLCIPHFQGVATPSFRPDVRGAFFGLTLSHGRAHLARAVMEAVCFSALDNLELVRRLCTPERLILIGGAAKSPIWMQMMADVMGKEVSVPENTEAATLGAAIMAAVGAGFYSDYSLAISKCVRMKERYLPNMENHQKYLAAYHCYRELMSKVYPGALECPVQA